MGVFLDSIFFLCTGTNLFLHADTLYMYMYM